MYLKAVTNLTNLDELMKWNVSNSIQFQETFNNCSLLENISGLKECF